MSKKRTSSKKAKALNGALLGAAATALTVKGALAGPDAVVAKAPVEQLKHNLEARQDEALAQSRQVLDQVGARAADVLAGVPAAPTADESGAAAPASRPPRAPRAMAPKTGEIQPDSPAGLAVARTILREAAARHGVDPKLVLAVSYWESGWDQSKVSATGAVGLMQVEPATAQDAGPNLLGRAVDISSAYDNADVGAAVLREDLDAFPNPAMALAAYYQGPTSLRANGMLPDTQQYVQGILSLVARM